MASLDKFKFSLSRQRIEYYYSIAILFIIPVLIVVNTLLLTQTVKKNFDIELRRKADLVNTIIGQAVKEQGDNSGSTQSMIDGIIAQRDEIDSLTVLKPTETPNNYIVVASDDINISGDEVQNAQYTIAATEERSIAALKTNQEGERVWSVVTPVYDEEALVALSSVDVSLAAADQLISNMLARSLFVLMAVVTVVVLLLLNHFKFVQYAVLFKKLKEVDQLKNDFLSVATHELKAPMAVIKGSLENVMDGVVGHVDEPAKEALQLALNDTDRLANLVTDLLNVSRIEQGRVTYNLEAVDVSEVVMRVVKQFQPRAQDKGLTIKYQQPEMDYLITVDRGRFLEIMTNLIDNAVKYSTKGTIVVKNSVKDEHIKTSVKDTGIGMTSQEREKLFSRFYRIQNEQTKNIGGTGLGLWIIKQYVEAMDGHIYVDSIEGVGSEFTVEFPLTAEKPPELTQHQPSATKKDN